MVGAIDFYFYGHVREGEIYLVVLVIDLEGNGHRDVGLGQLHYTFGALEEEGRLLSLRQAQVVARYVSATFEGEERGQGEGGLTGDTCETRVGTQVAPTGIGVVVSACAAAGGFVARGGGDEVVGGHPDGEVFYIEEVLSGPRVEGIYCKPDFRVEVVEGHPHFAVSRSGCIVDICFCRVNG